MISGHSWKWILGLLYIVAVALIWIASSFVVQSVVDDGVSPFLVTYICNALFVVYIPLVEIWHSLEDIYRRCLLRRNKEIPNSINPARPLVLPNSSESNHSLDKKVRWTRRKIAKASLLICPVWFMAQLTFNLSLKYTTVTSNTILSSSSSLFTFLIALTFLGEKFTWVKLISVLLCIGGTIAVSLGDSQAASSTVTAVNPILGNALAVLSAGLYAVYVTLVRWKFPDEDDEAHDRPSMAQFLGFLGLFNILLFLPIMMIIYFTKIESFSMLNGRQFGLIVGKGMVDNVMSEYLWAKAVVLTTTTVATAGLTIQVPLAAVVDTLIGNVPNLLDWVGAAAIMVGFTCISLPSD